jgi:hypothetical protein
MLIAQSGEGTGWVYMSEHVEMSGGTATPPTACSPAANRMRAHRRRQVLWEEMKCYGWHFLAQGRIERHRELITDSLFVKLCVTIAHSSVPENRFKEKFVVYRGCKKFRGQPHEPRS